MGKLATGARILMGAVFVLTGLNGFFRFLPEPELPPEVAAFLGALVNSGYLMQLVKATEIVGGALLLTGIAVPFALVLLAPIIVNIVLFHLVLAPSGLPLPLLLAACELVLAWNNRRRFRSLF